MNRKELFIRVIWSQEHRTRLHHQLECVHSNGRRALPNPPGCPTHPKKHRLNMADNSDASFWGLICATFGVKSEHQKAERETRVKLNISEAFPFATVMALKRLTFSCLQKCPCFLGDRTWMTEWIKTSPDIVLSPRYRMPQCLLKLQFHNLAHFKGF